MKLAAYCRVSTDKREQMDSLAHQKEFFAEYAQKNDHELINLYADEGISGTSLKKRDAFNRLMQDARKNLFQAVVVKDISRLARNTVDFLVSIRELKSMGIHTFFLTASMDTMGDSEFILTLFSAMAQEESSNLSKRVKFGKKINAEKGRVPTRIFGYDRIDNFTLAIHPEEANTVRKIFFLYSEQGLGCRTISQILNQDGRKTKYGNPWNSQGIRRVLTNPIYCGMLVNHKYEVEDFLTGKQVRIPKEDQLSHSRPSWAIVTPEAFQKAQQILASRRIQYDSGEPFRKGRYSSKHLFSTLIKCEHCGRSFTRKTYTYANTRVYWRCPTNDQYTAQRCDNSVALDESKLIEELRKYIASSLHNPEAFASNVLCSLLEKLPKQDDPEQRIRDFKNRKKTLLAKKERYQEMFANALLTLPQLREKLSLITSELESLARQTDHLTVSCSSQISGENKRQYYAEKIQQFLELDTVTNIDMRRMIDRISVNRDGTVRIFLKDFSSPINP